MKKTGAAVWKEQVKRRTVTRENFAYEGGMKMHGERQILFVNACVRPESRTRRLAQAVLDGMAGVVTEVNLEQTPAAPLNRESLAKRNHLLRAGNYSDDFFALARQFAAADEIVIAAPYWDLAFPALLRGYLEQVTVPGITFAYTPEGIPYGLCQACRLTYVTTAGGPILEHQYGYGYIQDLCRTFYGIREVICRQAEGLDLVGADPEAILADVVRELEETE